MNTPPKAGATLGEPLNLMSFKKKERKRITHPKDHNQVSTGLTEGQSKGSLPVLPEPTPPKSADPKTREKASLQEAPTLSLPSDMEKNQENGRGRRNSISEASHVTWNSHRKQ